MTENAPIKLANAEAVADVFSSWNAPLSLAVRDERLALYLVACNENGEIFYVGIPTEADENGEEIDRNTGWIDSPRDENVGPQFPLLMLGEGQW